MTKKVRNLYELVPEQKHPFETLDDGTVEVLLPRYGGSRVGRMLGGIFNNKPVRVRLDELGTSVWRLCDGEHSVRDIGESIHREFGETIEPLYERLRSFLEQMRRNDLIEWRD